MHRTQTPLAIGLKFLLACAGMATASGHAAVTRLVIDEVKPLATPPGQAIAYEQLAGRAFGELDPKLPGNALIQDIELGKDADGKVRYVASFVLTKPVDMAQASGLLWHDVPNRGRPELIAPAEQRFGDVGLASAWQGDDAAIDANNGTAVRPSMVVNGRHFLKLPVARHADGSPVTGLVFGRIVNRSGPDSQPLIVQTNPLPYKPASLHSGDARLVTRDAESSTGVVTNEVVVPPSDWAWARCGAGNPFPGTPDPTQICVRGGFDPAKLYMVTFTAKDPWLLGVGFAAWRDVGQFFKTAKADTSGSPTRWPAN